MGSKVILLCSSHRRTDLQAHRQTETHFESHWTPRKFVFLNFLCIGGWNTSNPDKISTISLHEGWLFVVRFATRWCPSRWSTDTSAWFRTSRRWRRPRRRWLSCPTTLWITKKSAATQWYECFDVFLMGFFGCLASPRVDASLEARLLGPVKT